MSAQNELNEQLLEAAKNGETAEVKALLGAGADVNAANEYGTTALMRAARGGHTETARALLAAGANVNAADEYGRTALIKAAECGQTEMAQALIAAGTNVDAANLEGKTALMWAADGGWTAIAQSLIDAKPNLDAADNAGWTALMYAVRNDHAETAQALIEADANLNAENGESMTALLLAMEYGRTETAQALIKAGADIEARDKKGWTLLTLAAERGQTETAQALIEADADVNAADENGETALMIALEKGHMEIVRKLVDAGAVVKSEDMKVKEALWAAAMERDAEKARALVDAGADAAQMADALRRAVLVFRELAAISSAGLNTWCTLYNSSIHLEDERAAAAALATLFAAGAFAPDAAAIAEICGEALEGIARSETTTLKAALEKAVAHQFEQRRTTMNENRGTNNQDVTEICGVKIEDVKKAIQEELKDSLGAWRESMDFDEFEEDHNACIEDNSTWVEAPFELARNAARFAKNEKEAKEGWGRAEDRLNLMLAGMAAQVKYGKNGIDEETIQARAKHVLDNGLLPTFETFDDLVAHLGKKERKRSLNI